MIVIKKQQENTVDVSCPGLIRGRYSRAVFINPPFSGLVSSVASQPPSPRLSPSRGVVVIIFGGVPFQGLSLENPSPRQGGAVAHARNNSRKFRLSIRYNARSAANWASFGLNYGPRGVAAVAWSRGRKTSRKKLELDVELDDSRHRTEGKR